MTLVPQMLERLQMFQVVADGAGPTGHLLVVDDQSTSRIYLSGLLRAVGYQVSEAPNGQEALEAIDHIRPDLVLLDVMMPDVNGFEVCERIKQNDQTRLIPVVLITSLKDKDSLVKGINAGADDFLSKPFDQVEMLARVRSLVHQKHLNDDLDNTAEVLFAIARSVEKRDPTTGDHCERLVQMGASFGHFLGLSRHQIKALKWAGYLHDIGKIGIPDVILGKKGRHTPEEWEIMKTHVLIGEEICKGLRSVQDVVPIIRHHHERYDGSGYPDQLQGGYIPLLARVFQIIDIFDALTSERPYKPAFTPEASMAILQEETHKGWRDPELVEAFKAFIPTYHRAVVQVR